MLTLQEVKEQLAQEYDEVALLELLQVSSSVLLDRFEDVIEANFNKYLDLVLPTEEEQEEELEDE